MPNFNRFFNDVACINAATLDEYGNLRGMSRHLNVELSGDFSDYREDEIPMRIRWLLNDPNRGFNNKLWISPTESTWTHKNIEDGRVEISTPSCQLTIPRRTIQFMNSNTAGEFTHQAIDSIQKFLFKAMYHNFPKADLDIRVRMSKNNHSVLAQKQPHMTFSFIHYHKSAKDATERSLAHGHTCYVEHIHNGFYNPGCGNCQKGIAQLQEKVMGLNNTIFIDSNDIQEEDEKKITISYETGGNVVQEATDDVEEIREPFEKWQATLDKTMNKIIKIDGEPTIQSIMDWFISESSFGLQHGQVESLYISEGLNSGAVRHVFEDQQ